MLPRIVGLVLVLVLALPSAVMAAETTPVRPCPDGAEVCIQPVAPDPRAPDPRVPHPAGRYFYIATVERSGVVIKIEGKLAIEAGRLFASVGCNSIGGEATFDGQTLAIGELATTEMACEGHLAEAERALWSALRAGPLTWTGSAFSGAGVTIQASEAGAVPVVPPDGGITDPNTPITEPGAPKPNLPGPIDLPLPGFDLEACRSFIPEQEWQAVFGPIAGGGSGGGGGGSVGGGEPGQPPVVVDPVPPSTPLAEPRPVEPRPTPVGTPIVDPDPTAVATTGPVETPAPSGEPTPAASPAPSPAEQPTPAPTDTPGDGSAPETGATPAGVVTEGVTTVVAPQRGGEQPVTVDLPASGEPSDARRLPIQADDGPAPTPSAEYCRQLLTRIRTLAVGAPAAVSSDGQAETVNARDLAAEGVATTAVDPLAGLVLVLVVGGLLVAWLRSIPGRGGQP